MAKSATADKRLTINLTETELLQLAELAHRSQASLSQLGKLAIKQLLLRSDDMLPLLPKVDMEALPLPEFKGFKFGGR